METNKETPLTNEQLKKMADEFDHQKAIGFIKSLPKSDDYKKSDWYGLIEFSQCHERCPSELQDVEDRYFHEDLAS